MMDGVLTLTLACRGAGSKCVGRQFYIMWNEALGYTPEQIFQVL